MIDFNGYNPNPMTADGSGGSWSGGAFDSPIYDSSTGSDSDISRQSIFEYVFKNAGKSIDKDYGSVAADSDKPLNNPIYDPGADDVDINNLLDGKDYKGTSSDPKDWLELYQKMLEEDRAYNSAEAQKNRDYQEYMSNTQYQRAIADMRAAGINPLIALGGSFTPASTPSGATASSNSGNPSSIYSTMMKQMLGNANLIGDSISDVISFIIKIVGIAALAG